MRANTLPILSRIPLGRTGLRISRLALGTVELGLDYGIPVPGSFGKPTDADAVALVHAALDAGINYIDTARAYGDSECVLGKALKGRRGQVVLASKVVTQMADPRATEADLRTRMESDLERTLAALDVEYLDVWQVHNLDRQTLAGLDTVAEVFHRARSAGKVRFTGASFYGVELPMLALDSDLFDVMQVTYSVADQRIAQGFLQEAQARGVGVVARSILLKGVLTARGDHLPPHLALLTALSQRFRAIVAQHLPGVTPAQAAIAFGLAQPAIHAVLVGLRDRQELDENIAAATLNLPPEFLDACAMLRLDDDALLNPSTWGIP